MRVVSTIALALGLGAVLSVTPAEAQAPNLANMDFVLRSVPDGPVAKVNGVNISPEEFVGLYQEKLAATILRAGSRKVSEQVRLQTGIQSLVLLVQRELLRQEAARRNLVVTKAELEERWAAELDIMKKMAPSGERGKLSEADILAEAGATRAEALDELRKALLADKMREELAKGSGVEVTDAEIAKAFEEHKDMFKRPDKFHLKQIYVKIEPGQEAAARKRIEKAVKRLKSGESFEGVAKAISQAPGKDEGGDMGLTPAPALPPFFVEAAREMDAGGVSGIIQSSFGLHIIKLVEFVPGADSKLEDVRKHLRRMLASKKADAAVEDFCRSFMDKPGYIEVFLQLDKSLAAQVPSSQ